MKRCCAEVGGRVDGHSLGKEEGYCVEIIVLDKSVENGVAVTSPEDGVAGFAYVGSDLGPGN